MGQFCYPNDPFASFEFADNSHAGCLAARVNLDFDRLRIPIFTFFENDGEGIPPQHSRFALLEQVSGSCGDDRASRLLGSCLLLKLVA